MSKPSILNFCKHVAQLINKHRVRGPPIVQLLNCDNCCTCTELKLQTACNNTTFATINAKAEPVVVRKQSRNEGETRKLLPLKFTETNLVVRYSINLQWFCFTLKHHQLVAALLESIYRYSRLHTWWCTDHVIFLMPASRFHFHGDITSLSALKCLQ